MKQKSSKKPVAAANNTLQPPARKRGASLTFALLLGIVSFLAYANTLKNGFALDDTVMITQNKIVAKGISAIPELLSTPHQRGFWVTPNDEYRPLSLVMFATLHELTGNEPTLYHLMNVVLFVACVVLLFRFLNELFNRKKTAVAFIAALLFALHPVHTEVVANIKSSDELLGFFFAFFSLNVFISYVKFGNIILLSAGTFCFFLSLLSKETILTFNAVVPLVFFVFINENKKRSLHLCLGSAFATVLFLVIRYAVFKVYHINSIPEISVIENALVMPGLSFESRIATAVLIMGYYIKLLFIPHPLICDYSFHTIPYTHFTSPWVLISAGMYIALAALCIRLFIKKSKDPYAFALSFFLITISLFSNIFILIKSTLGERFLFFPSVGFCVVIALLLEKWAVKTTTQDEQILRNPKVLGILVPLCLVYLFVTAGRNAEWLNNYTLYKADVAKSPDNCRLNYFMGDQFFNLYKDEPELVRKRELIDSALHFYHTSVAIFPAYIYALQDMGAAYFRLGQFDSAEVFDARAVAIEPKNAVARNNLSGVYLNTKKFKQDIDFCKRSIMLLPDNVYAYADIGISYTNTGEYDSAVYYLNKGIAIDPKFYGLYDVMGSAYYAMGKPDSGRKYKYIAQTMH